jgi:hypothetical protein
MLCPKCSLPTEVDIQSVMDAALMSDRFDDNGVPLPHRRHCLYRHDTWVGVLPLAFTASARCREHGQPRPCRVCAARYAVTKGRTPAELPRRLTPGRWEAPCACGCGETFLTNGRRRFYSDACRLRLAARRARHDRLNGYRGPAADVRSRRAAQ